jgi:glycosyltransferase involved in cell wall biosynthesis
VLTAHAATRPAAPVEQREPIVARSAIVHDWFQGFHGAERVVDAMRTGLFDEAPDIFTFHAARSLLPPELAAAIVRESTLASLPGIRQRQHDPGLWRNLLPLMPRYFARLELDPYDLVISSSHAFAANVRPRADALHVCYCYTPLRYAWLPDVEEGRVGGSRGLALSLMRRRLRQIDRKASGRPDAYIAISTAVRTRIQSFYGRDAVVVHPPVDVEEFDPGREKDPDRFLWVHRLVSYKHPELVVEAFRDLPYQLTMVGVGPLESRLRPSLPSNVELRSWVSRRELIELFERSSGFIHVADEDFGITMVEALAAGTPVIGLARGGARDIVRDGVDGLLLERVELDSIRSAVRSLRATSWDRAAIAAGSRRFSRARFVDQLRGCLGELGERKGLDLAAPRRL